MKTSYSLSCYSFGIIDPDTLFKYYEITCGMVIYINVDCNYGNVNQCLPVPPLGIPLQIESISHRSNVQVDIPIRMILKMAASFY